MGPQDIHENAITEREMSPLERLGYELENFAEELHFVINSLEKRLEGVLSPEADEKENVAIEADPSFGGSALVGKLQQSKIRVDYACRRVNKLIRRLEV